MNCDNAGYQCRFCCADRHHGVVGSFALHKYFCVDGAPSNMQRYATWSDGLLEMAKTQRRMLQEATAPDPIATMQTLAISTPRQESQPTTVAANVAVKVERQVQPPPRRTHDSNTVDLTEDDDDAPVVKPEPYSDNTATSANLTFGTTRTLSTAGPAAPAPAPVIKAESAWLAAAAASAQQSSSTSFGDDGDDDDWLANEDPGVLTMIEEYNRLSEVIFNTEQSFAEKQSEMKALITNPSGDMNEVLQLRTQSGQLRNLLQKETHNRNAVIARLVVYLKPVPGALTELLESTADIPYAQSASHRSCAQAEAALQNKRQILRTLKRQLMETLNMKTKVPYAEVNELGKMIAKEEAEVRQLQENRLEEFVRLFQFSDQIRKAARSMITQ